LDDFRPKPPYSKKGRATPRANGTNGSHYLAPGDLATIYDIAPLYNHGFDGTGQTIVVVGQTDVDPADVAYFRQYFGLPPNNPSPLVVGDDPGTVQGELDEANLDLDWAGAIAPGATVVYVIAKNAWDAVAYAIDNDLAKVISDSYGYCEPQISSAPLTSALSHQQQAQQANLQGTTWIAASGDAGAAACDAGVTSAVNGLAVQLPASIPEVTGIGGTEFTEGSGTYWGASGSALKWIPEMAWNDTQENGSLAASGGGASIFFSKPSWQAGPGVPNDGWRDVPDMALAASPYHDGYAIAINGGLASFEEGGTSAAAPVFAGIAVLLNQYLVSTGAQSQPGLQNINPTLYRLAQGTSDLFHDVTAGSNIVPCTVGTTNCPTGQLGYTAGPGYDQVTGLGSIDAYNLVTGWATPASSASITTVAANPATIATTASTVLTATVKAASGNTSPGGTVTFTAGSTTLGTAQLSGSGGSSTAILTVAGSTLGSGSNLITATYGGGPVFNSSSGTATVTVSGSTPSSHVTVSVTPDPVYQQAANAGGYQWFYTVTLTETAGVATTVTSFTFSGADYSSDIASWFGSTTLPANGSLSANLEWKGLTVPVNVVIAFTGRDSASATPWTAQITVPFLGPQVVQGYIITTVAGNGTSGYSGDGGPATHAQFNGPNGVAVDGAANLYIADSGNNVIRMVASNGTITTVAGNGIAGYSGDGGPAISAELDGPAKVAVDGIGNLYIADFTNKVIREVVPSHGITTMAGNGGCSSQGDGGPATSASLCFPLGVAVDTEGNLYVADAVNERVRKVATNGTITTVAGTGTAGYSGDTGLATEAQLAYPTGLAVDTLGDLYIADTGNHVIRKVTRAGIITTVAGNGTRGYSGDGRPATTAQLNSPEDTAVDGVGNLYIADSGNYVIREVTVDGTIATIAGNGTYGYSGDGGPATSAQLRDPFAVAVDGAGHVYVSDSDNLVVRLLTPQASGSGSAALAITKTHQGNFSVWGGTYTIVVGNAAGAAPTSGAVTVTENIPSGLIVSGMSGTGWSCSGATCTRSDVLNAGSSYPPITVNAGTSGVHASQVTNHATVSGGGSASATASDVTQFAASAVVVTAGSLPSGIVGGSYSTTLSATGGVAPYKWTLALIGSSLPNGLALDPSGVISGIPTAAGSFSFNINANDSTGAWSSGAFQLTINPAPSGILTRSGICAQIASGGAWMTTLTVANIDTVPIQVKVNFWGDNGQALTLPLTFPQEGGGAPANASFVERSLAVGASLVIQSSGSSASSTVEGWAEILATGPAGAFAIFRDQVNSQLTPEGTAALDAHNQASFMLPFDNTAGYVTSIAIVNNSSTQQAAGMTATVLDENGVTLAENLLISNLPPNGHTAFSLPVEFSATAGKRGVIQIQSTWSSGITALGLRFSPTSSFTSIPVMYP
jgi:hypothetical protein